MSGISYSALLVIMIAALITAALFMLYQNSLMEIYLADWALC